MFEAQHLLLGARSYTYTELTFCVMKTYKLYKFILNKKKTILGKWKIIKKKNDSLKVTYKCVLTTKFSIKKPSNDLIEMNNFYIKFLFFLATHNFLIDIRIYINLLFMIDDDGIILTHDGMYIVHTVCIN